LYLLVFIALSFASKSFPQPPDPSQIPEPQIAYALHAVWTPDLTVTPSQSQCVTSGTVAIHHFHFYEGPRGPFQTSITINVQNLVVTSPDETKVLK